MLQAKGAFLKCPFSSKKGAIVSKFTVNVHFLKNLFGEHTAPW